MTNKETGPFPLPSYPEGQEVLFERRLNLPISMGCEILRIAVTEANNDDLVYTGALELMDHIEQMRGTYIWLAKPGPQKHTVFGQDYWMDVNPVRPFWGPGIFTLQKTVDRDIRHQIVHALVEFNPALPFTEPEPEPYQPPLFIEC